MAWGKRQIIRPYKDWEIRKVWELTVKERDKYLCGRCQKKLSPCAARAHHILPREFGGLDTPDNGITLCCSCHNITHINLKKGMGLFDAIGIEPR